MNDGAALCKCTNADDVCPYRRPDGSRVCELTPSEEARILGARKCPVHLVVEPCPTCSAYIAAGL